MKKHAYNFDGGDQLNKISSSWFVSYYWYKLKDANHKNWQRVSTYPSRISRFEKTKNWHKMWMETISKMNPDKLSQNKIGLTGNEIVDMATELLKLM